jgi:hypothetical protein
VTVTPTVDDAVRSHVSWMTALAGLPGGATWTDGPLRWAYDASSRTLHAMFPDTVPVDAVRRGLDRAREHGAAHVAVWSAVDASRPDLVDIGFEVGWQPWWMGAATATFDDGPVRLSRRVVAARRAGPREAARQPLLDRADTWRAEARAPGERCVGGAWGHLGGGAAGLYDMVVGPGPRPRHLGGRRGRTPRRRPAGAQRHPGGRAALHRVRVHPPRRGPDLVVARTGADRPCRRHLGTGPRLRRAPPGDDGFWERVGG